MKTKKEDYAGVRRSWEALPLCQCAGVLASTATQSRTAVGPLSSADKNGGEGAAKVLPKCQVDVVSPASHYL